MLIQVTANHGPDTHVEVTEATDEREARLLAYLFAYEGHANPDDAEDTPDDTTLGQYTAVVKPAASINARTGAVTLP